MLVKTGAQPSVVIRNLQLGIFSLAFATSAVIFNDWSAIAKDGFFQGYHSLVFVIIILQVSPIHRYICFQVCHTGSIILNWVF